MYSDMWVEHSKDEKMSSWLKSSLNDICSCGGTMLNYYNMDGRCTGRMCSNESCPDLLAERIVFIANMFDLTGIGPATALNCVKNKNLNYAYQALPYICNGKITTDIAHVVWIALFLKGVANQWKTICAPYDSLEQFLEEYKGEFSAQVQAGKGKILECATYINVVERKPKKYDCVLNINVMITGSVKDFPRTKRELFIAQVNHLFEGLVNIRYYEARKTGIHVLIAEDKMSATTKVRYAKEQGAKILNSEEFMDYIVERLNEVLGGQS